MRAPRTLWLYVTREVIQYSLLGLAAIGIVMVTRSLVRVLDELMGAGFRAEDLAALLRVLSTMLLIYAVPVSFLFGVLLALGRMAGDVEIVAMRACGFGPASLLVPVGALGLALSGATLVLSLEVEPAARRDLSGVLQRLLVRGASIESGRFNRVGDRTFYVNERDAEGRLRGVMIADRSDPERPFTVFAESGEVLLDEGTAELTLRLGRGDVHIDLRDDPERYQRVAFESLEYRIDVAAEMGTGAALRPREMRLADLRAVVARIRAGAETGSLRDPPLEYEANLHRRYARPAAPALFALIGLPIGMMRRRGARSTGVILCAALAFAYYALHSFSEVLIVEQGFPPLATSWMPNLLTAAVGLALLARAQRAG